MTSRTVGRLAYISRNVTDLSRSVAFYCERLGFSLSGPIYIVDPTMAGWLGLPSCRLNARRIKYGNEEIELVEIGGHGRPYPLDGKSADLLFQHFAVRCQDIELACSRLFRNDIDVALPSTISRGSSSGMAVTLPARSGGVAAFKFRDPDGHPVELIQFPANAPDAKQTIGIDHSAISISDPIRSIDFYAATLGLSVTARQINSGVEQDALDNLTAAKVDVIALAFLGSTGPHLELLGYHTTAEQPPHRDCAPTDIASDRLVFEVCTVSDSGHFLVDSGVPDVSSGTKLCQDPDGHFLVIETMPHPSVIAATPYQY